MDSGDIPWEGGPIFFALILQNKEKHYKLSSDCQVIYNTGENYLGTCQKYDQKYILIHSQGIEIAISELTGPSDCSTDYLEVGPSGLIQDLTNRHFCSTCVCLNDNCVISFYQLKHTHTLFFSSKVNVYSEEKNTLSVTLTPMLR